MSCATLVLACSAGLALLSCGYSTGHLIRPGFQKVYLPLFTNMTFYRELELALTQQVEGELASRPGIFIVPREKADIVLKGTILEFRETVLSEDDRDQVRESSVWAKVKVEVLDARNAVVLKQFEVTDRAEFFLARGENLRSATSESFFDLARKIVAGLETDFETPSQKKQDPPARVAGNEELSDV